MTPYIWKLGGAFWSTKQFPMVMIKPFGYSHKRTVLQFVCFWFWFALTIGYHYYKFNQSEKIKASRKEAKNLLEESGDSSKSDEIEEV